ncbi:MAG: hypothetical protein CMJ81_04735 [Planctomycetaceae bacterium]|nr:hypothetical protein [Planctomycetaceae bacterium]
MEPGGRSKANRIVCLGVIITIAIVTGTDSDLPTTFPRTGPRNGNRSPQPGAFAVMLPHLDAFVENGSVVRATRIPGKRTQ